MDNIKELVQGTTAQFAFYRDNQLWYKIVDCEKPTREFLFPVPIEDIGNATFNRNEKGLMMMRYVRKQLEFLEKANEAKKSGTSI